LALLPKMKVTGIQRETPRDRCETKLPPTDVPVVVERAFAATARAIHRDDNFEPEWDAENKKWN
jgi:hypothetical protein